tara:strand:+ start:393 stop:707 length:315 start_codon:yes stop_codon:yes gene_type:complete
VKLHADRSIDQNKMFHAIIGQIAKQATLHGSRWSAESWKRFLIDQWAHESNEMASISKVMPSIDGERVVQLGHQSRRFTKEQATSFTEWLLYWAANNGVEIEIH